MCVRDFLHFFYLVCLSMAPEFFICDNRKNIFLVKDDFLAFSEGSIRKQPKKKKKKKKKKEYAKKNKSESIISLVDQPNQRRKKKKRKKKSLQNFFPFAIKKIIPRSHNDPDKI